MLAPENLRQRQLVQFKKIRQRPAPQRLHLLLLDSSGSAAASLPLAKGVIAELSRHCYLQREQLALFSFAGERVERRLKLQRAPKRLAPLLQPIGAGGGTPLAEAMAQAQRFIRQIRARQPGCEVQLYLLSDGRSRALERLEKPEAPLLIIDTERQPVRLGRCRALAARLGADYRHIDSLQIETGATDNQETEYE